MGTKNIPLAFENKVAFTIRDDDISYFTQPWMLEKLYEEAWRLGFKVSLAVTPYVKATTRRHIPHSLRGTNKFFSISKNEELVDYLLEKIAEGSVDIVQHGFTHERENGVPEFCIDDFKSINERLKRGNKLLCQTFKQDITVFAAPHEGVSKAAWKSLSRNGMCLCRKFTLGRFLMTAPITRIDFRKLAKTFFHSPNPFKPISNSIIDLADILVIQWDAFFWSESRKKIRLQLEDAKEKFLKRLNRGEAFVLAHHYWDYFLDWDSRRVKKDMITCFNDLLNFVSLNRGVWKTTLGEIYSKTEFSMNKNLRQ